MPLLSIVLVTISAFIHAGWNLICKKENLGEPFMLIGLFVGALAVLPILFFSPALSNIPLHVWLLIPLTGFFMAIYLLSLARAYNSGDMSVIYPTVRSVSVVLVTVILLLYRQESFSVLYFMGSGLIILGLFIMHPLSKNNNSFFPTNFLTSSFKYALLAALGAAGYSLVDESALNILKQLESFTVGITPLTYLALHGTCASIWLLVFVCRNKKERNNLIQVFRSNKKNAVITGLGMYTGYGLVLASMIYAENVGYVLVFRQMGIPIGGILSLIFLKEKINATRFTGTMLIFTGLVMVGLG